MMVLPFEIGTLHFIGIGLHTGRRIVMHVRPAPAESGIWFARLDLPEAMQAALKPDLRARLGETAVRDMRTTPATSSSSTRAPTAATTRSGSPRLTPPGPSLVC